MKRLAIAVALTLPIALIGFLFGALTGVRGVDLIGGTAIMGLTSVYLLYSDSLRSA